MKMAKKLTAIAVSSLMMFSIAGMNVFAASTTQTVLRFPLPLIKKPTKKIKKSPPRFPSRTQTQRMLQMWLWKR